jgi:hypothetical protein
MPRQAVEQGERIGDASSWKPRPGWAVGTNPALACQGRVQCNSAQIETIVINKNPDLNSDGLVNCADLAILENQYGSTGPALCADLDGDGTVTGHDLSLLISEWSTGQPTTC